MTPSKRPKGPEGNVETQVPVPNVGVTRDEARALLNSPQLPEELAEGIMEADMKQDMKLRALMMCNNLDVILQRLSCAPDRGETVKSIENEISNLIGKPLYEEIIGILEVIEAKGKRLVEKSTESADYLRNTQDEEGGPRRDMESVIKTLERITLLRGALESLQPSNYAERHKRELQEEMQNGDTEFAALYRLQRALEKRIGRALIHGGPDQNAARLVLEATVNQVDMAYKAVSQKGHTLSLRVNENDLGKNDAERQMTILDSYWHVLAIFEGFSFLKDFYPSTSVLKNKPSAEQQPEHLQP